MPDKMSKDDKQFGLVVFHLFALLAIGHGVSLIYHLFWESPAKELSSLGNQILILVITAVAATVLLCTSHLSELKTPEEEIQDLEKKIAGLRSKEESL